MDDLKSRDNKDIIQKCVDEDAIIYAFVIPDKLAYKFEKLIKNKNTTGCELLVSLVKNWVNDQ